MAETVECNALSVRIDALSTLLNEREARTKDRFAAMDRITVAAFAASEKAIEKADAANQRHFGQINEFRAALEDQTQKYLEKSVYSAQHEALASRLDAFATRLHAIEGQITANSAAAAAQTRATQWFVGIALALVAPTVGLLVFFLSHH